MIVEVQQAMEQVVFQVEKIFDLPGYSTLLVAGIVQSGIISAGTELRVQRSGAPITVSGVEIVHRRDTPDSVTVRISRSYADALREDDVLESLPAS